MTRPFRRLLALPVCAALGLLASSAAAQEAVVPAGAVVRPAPTLTDPQTGAKVVDVPPGCTATRHASGQVVILCPFAAPDSAAAASAVPPQPVTEKKWYGWQTLIIDGASITTGLLLVGSGHEGLQGAGGTIILGGYALGGPIVHWANGQVGKGFASLGLRVGAPVVLGFAGGLIGSAGSSSNDWDDSLSGGALGVVLGAFAGYATAVALDAAVLARKTVKVSAAEERRSRNKLKWSPTAGYDPKRQTVSLGVGGTF